MRAEDPLHPIIERSFEYEIVQLSYNRSLHGEFETFLDLTLKKDATVRHLRFFSPQELEIEKGFLTKTSGLVILDVSARGLEGIGVRVDDFEASWGAVRFWARAVIELGQFTKA
ncbi:MAG: hypothetical protein ACJ74W_11200 [Pyrinomonadaceae bacterium]